MFLHSFLFLSSWGCFDPTPNLSPTFFLLCFVIHFMMKTHTTFINPQRVWVYTDVGWSGVSRVENLLLKVTANYTRIKKEEWIKEQFWNLFKTVPDEVEVEMDKIRAKAMVDVSRFKWEYGEDAWVWLKTLITWEVGYEVDVNDIEYVELFIEIKEKKMLRLDEIKFEDGRLWIRYYSDDHAIEIGEWYEDDKVYWEYGLFVKLKEDEGV